MTLFMPSPQFDLSLFFFLAIIYYHRFVSIDHNDNKSLTMIFTINLYSLFLPLAFLLEAW
jgi:hypothetical protein